MYKRQFYAFALLAILGWGIWLTHKKGKVLANTIILCVTVILIGYGSYASVIIRSSVNPPMNSNGPKMCIRDSLYTSLI